MSEIPFGRPWITEADRAAVAAVLDSPVLTHGPRCHAFEQAFAAYIGGGTCVTTSSCTAALHLFWMHAGVGQGDEVICPALSHVATAHAIEITGARPKFVDCTDATGTLDANLVEGALSSATKGICVVHFNGMPADMSAITEIARKHGLPLLEDCATALGGRWDGRHVGLFGSGSAFSFYPAKHITSAEGGMFVSADSAVADSVRGRRGFCYDRSLNERALPGIYDVNGLGLNYRMSELQAALGNAQLQRVDQFLEIRRRNAARYVEKLGKVGDIRILASADARAVDAHYCLTVMLDGRYASRRNDLIALLKQNGIGTSVHYPHPLPRLKYYREKYGYDPAQFPNASALADRSFNLPVAPHIDAAAVDRICDVLQECLATM